MQNFYREFQDKVLNDTREAIAVGDAQKLTDAQKFALAYCAGVRVDFHSECNPDGSITMRATTVYPVAVAFDENGRPHVYVRANVEPAGVEDFRARADMLGAPSSYDAACNEITTKPASTSWQNQNGDNSRAGGG